MSEFTGEHEHEPLRGFPGSLPPGETLLWQGRPLAWRLARQIFPIRAIGAYFLLFAAWRLYGGLTAELAPAGIAVGVGTVVLMAALAIGGLVAYAAMIARTTVFSITDRRVLVRYGFTLPKTWNVPFRSIEAASFKPAGPRTSAGDLCLTVNPQERIPYVLLWPYARPWRWRNPQPLLRALPDGEHAAALLGRALQASLNSTATRVSGQRTSAPAARDATANLTPQAS